MKLVLISFAFLFLRIAESSYRTRCPALKLLGALAMKQAECYNVTGCLKEISSFADKQNQCMECICGQESASAYADELDNVPVYDVPSFSMTPAQLFCRSDRVINIEWEAKQDDKTKVAYVVERSEWSDMTWVPTIVTFKTRVVMANLQPNTVYQFRVRAISANGQIGKSVVSKEIKTLPVCKRDGFLPPVKNVSVSVVKISSNISTVKLSWQPSKDMNCQYALHLQNGELGLKRGLTHYSDERNMSFSLNIAVKNEATYKYSLKAISGNCESKGYENEIRVSCLEAFKNNLSYCVPPKPQSLKITFSLNSTSTNEHALYDIEGSWIWPLPQKPLYFEINLKTSNNLKEISNRYSNISGDETSLKFGGVYIGNMTFTYVVRACSLVGCGLEVLEILPTSPSDKHIHVNMSSENEASVIKEGKNSGDSNVASEENNDKMKKINTDKNEHKVKNVASSVKINVIQFLFLQILTMYFAK